MCLLRPPQCLDGRGVVVYRRLLLAIVGEVCFLSIPVVSSDEVGLLSQLDGDDFVHFVDYDEGEKRLLQHRQAPTIW